MERVHGIGGVFFKAKDPPALAKWYADHLGVPVEGGIASFRWKDDDLDGSATTVWSAFAADTTYFAPSTKPFMLNFRVKSLVRMLAQLRAAGAAVDERVEDSPYGRFGWVMDPEGNRVELWEPPASEGAPAPTPPVDGTDAPVATGLPPAPSGPSVSKPSAGKRQPARKAKASKKRAPKKKAAAKPKPRKRR